MAATIPPRGGHASLEARKEKVLHCRPDEFKKSSPGIHTLMAKNKHAAALEERQVKLAKPLPDDSDTRS